MVSSVVKISSLLSFGKEVLLTFTLNCVISCRSQSDALSGEASTRSLIALVVALSGVMESSFAVATARFLLPPFVVRVGTKRRCWPRLPPLPPLLPRLPLPPLPLPIDDEGVTVVAAWDGVGSAASV